MEFLGVGYQEIFLVLVLLLVFVGPERLPAMAYQIGRAVRTMQQYARAVRNEFSDEFEYIEEQYKTVKGQVEDTRKTLRDEDRKLQSELREATAVELPALLPPDAPATNGTAASHPEVVPPATAEPEGLLPPPQPATEDPKPASPPMVF